MRVQFYQTKSTFNETPKIPQEQSDILYEAYLDNRYGFWNVGWPNAGSFGHCLTYGYFDLNDDEARRYKELIWQEK